MDVGLESESWRKTDPQEEWAGKVSPKAWRTLVFS